MANMNGYKYVYMPSHHKAMQNGVVYEHILVAEKMLGRPIENEVVHHIDLNRSNNEESNLMIFSSISDHTAFHMGVEYYSIDGIYYTKQKTYYCLDCGKEISHKANRCIECNKIYIRNLQQSKSILKNKNLSRDNLKDLKIGRASCRERVSSPV